MNIVLNKNGNLREVQVSGWKLHMSSAELTELLDGKLTTELRSVLVVTQGTINTYPSSMIYELTLLRRNDIKRLEIFQK